MTKLELNQYVIDEIYFNIDFCQTRLTKNGNTFVNDNCYLCPIKQYYGVPCFDNERYLLRENEGNTDELNEIYYQCLIESVLNYKL